MFNLVKVLELTLNDGKCMISGRQIGLNTGYLHDYSEYNDLRGGIPETDRFFH